MKQLLKDLRDLLILAVSLTWNKITGKATPKGHFSLINLFCTTGGTVNDFLTRLISLFHVKNSKLLPSPFFGSFGKDEVSKVVNALESDGFCVLDQKISEDIIDQLSSSISSIKTQVRPSDIDRRNNNPRGEMVYFDKDNVIAIRYDYHAADLFKIETVQQLLADPFFLAVSEQYLKASPILDIVTAWWHAGFGQVADDAAAQRFHFDMDRIKWLKVFIYLTDVNEENGPHCFIKGSHKTHGIPKDLLKRGYSRLDDEEVYAHYGADKVIEFVGAKGTVILEDTRGLHKGKHVMADPRLIFQLEYTNSLFGASTQAPGPQAELTGTLKQSLKSYPKLMSYFSK